MSNLPAWNDLPEHDKAQVVAFLRKAEDEGLEYTWENYPPKFGEGSPLAEVDDREIRDAYQSGYDALDYGDEFWRLYEIAVP